MRNVLENISSVIKILFGVYGLNVAISSFFNSWGGWWIVAVLISLPLVVLGIFGLFNLIRKPINIRVQVIFELILLILFIIGFFRSFEVFGGFDIVTQIKIYESNPYLIVYDFLVLPIVVLDLLLFRKMKYKN